MSSNHPSDATNTEDSRQDPEDGSVNPGQRKDVSDDDAMRRDRAQINREQSGGTTRPNAGQDFDKSSTNRDAPNTESGTKA